MRTLFLTAKKFAIDAKALEITLEHIKQAVSTIEFVDDKAKVLICEYLHSSNAPFVSYSNLDIEAASKHGTIKFSDDVVTFKKHTESKGFSLGTVVTKLFIEKKMFLQLSKLV